MSQAAVTCPGLGEKLIELADELALGQAPRLRPLATEVRDLAYRVDCPAEAAAISRVRADALGRAICKVRGEVLAELASSGTEGVEPVECGERVWKSAIPRRQLFPLPPWARRSMGSVWLNTGGLETGDQRWSDLEQVRTLCASIQTGLDPRSVSGRRIPLDPQRTAEMLRMLGERFKVGADGGPDKADDATLEPKAVGQASASTTTRPKRSTNRGDARVKLIAALTKYHGYQDGSCEHPGPAQVNELARMAEVSGSTSSDFFKAVFGGHRQYTRMCHRSVHEIAQELKSLNDDYTELSTVGDGASVSAGEQEEY